MQLVIKHENSLEPTPDEQMIKFLDSFVGKIAGI